jgi:hypothetical protein
MKHHLHCVANLSQKKAPRIERMETLIQNSFGFLARYTIDPRPGHAPKNAERIAHKRKTAPRRKSLYSGVRSRDRRSMKAMLSRSNRTGNRRSLASLGMTVLFVTRTLG